MSNNDIKEVLHKLNQLNLRRAAIDIEETTLRAELQQALTVERTRNGVGNVDRQEQNRETHTPDQPEGETVEEEVRQDRNGVDIRIGSRVRILTRGGFNSRQGTIVRFTNNRVVILDSNNREQHRAARNVQLLD